MGPTPSRRTSAREAESSPVIPAARATGVLYGRDGELAEIRQLVEQARSGQSGALLVCGDAGTGKTALLEEAAQAAHGMQVIRGTCIESEAELPFAGLHLLLRSAMDQIAALPRPQAARCGRPSG